MHCFARSLNSLSEHSSVVFTRVLYTVYSELCSTASALCAKNQLEYNRFVLVVVVVSRLGLLVE